MADELIMGIDAGTSRVRVLVFEMDGTVVAGSSEPKVDRPIPGGLQPNLRIYGLPVWKR